MFEILDGIENDQHSPVHINSKEAIPIGMGPLIFTKFWDDAPVTLVNDGERGPIFIPSRRNSVDGGPFITKYKFRELHFHWTTNDFDGSEHAIDGEKGSIEAHFVFTEDSKIVIEPELLEAHRILEEKRRTAREDECDSEELRIFEAQLEEKEERLLEDRWMKEKSRKALHSRRPTKFEFITLPENKERDKSIDVGYRDEDILRIGNMPPEEFVKFQDLVKGQQVAKKNAERKANLDAKIEYVRWKAKEDELDEHLRRVRCEQLAQEERDIKALRQSLDNCQLSRQAQKIQTEDYIREKFNREEANRRMDENIKKRRQRELEAISTREISVVSIIAVIFEIQDDAPFYKLLNYLSLVESPFSQVMVTENLLKDFEQVMTSNNYYAYSTHECIGLTQGITWVVMKDVLPIRRSQIAGLRKLKTFHGGYLTNFRRPLKGKRKVFVNRMPCPKVEFVCPGKRVCLCDGNAQRKPWEYYTCI